MRTQATLRYLRQAPRKVREVADMIRGKSPQEAEVILKLTTRKAALPLRKLLMSAVASLENTLQVKKDPFVIESIMVGEGPKFKRWMPRARGQADMIQKKTSHVSLVLSAPDEKVEKIEAPEEKNTSSESKGEEKSKKKERKQEPPRPAELQEKKPKERVAEKKMFRRKSV